MAPIRVQEDAPIPPSTPKKKAKVPIIDAQTLYSKVAKSDPTWWELLEKLWKALIETYVQVSIIKRAKGTSSPAPLIAKYNPTWWGLLEKPWKALIGMYTQVRIIKRAEGTSPPAPWIAEYNPIWWELLEKPWKESRGVGNITNPLDNEIHPILTRSKLDLPESLYDRIQPALRLVSLWITHSSFQPWFEHLATGKLEFYPNGVGPVFEKAKVEPTQSEKTKAVEKHWQTLEKCIDFTWFHGAHPEPYPKQRVNGYIRMDYEIPKGTIAVSLDFVVEIDKSSPSSARFLILQYMLAKVFAHELAHAFQHLAAADHIDAEDPDNWEWPEAFWESPEEFPDLRHHEHEQFAEGGFSFEQFIEGGRGAVFDVTTYKSVEIGKELLCLMSSRDIRNFNWIAGDNDKFFLYLATPRWVKAWFEKETWEKISKDGHGFMHEGAKEETVHCAVINPPSLGASGTCIVGPDMKTVRAMATVRGIDAGIPMTFNVKDKSIRWKYIYINQFRAKKCNSATSLREAKSVEAVFLRAMPSTSTPAALQMDSILDFVFDEKGDGIE
ncbi:hypothetical protein CC80DRAFT_508199 [Byssothecium circinans]|uniref:Uncharacterized protein n=1 Tax=Byssothecium circinans TaxID=147558 RepID=A0A6A5THQ6_9PLEO|nr:hypothetical protein CC80DRAFT_508199 [Byssothecium circinans]